MVLFAVFAINNISLKGGEKMKKLVLLLLLLTGLLARFEISISANEMNPMTMAVDPNINIEEETPSNTYGLTPTASVNVNNYLDLEVGKTYTSSRWRVGIIEHYYKYRVDSITRYYGVYSNYFQQYYSQSILQSGNVTSTLTSARIYDESSSFTYYFSKSVNFALESSVYVSAFGAYEGISASSDIEAKSNMYVSYSYNYLYSRKAFSEQTFQSSVIIDNMLAVYCPTGYALSIGDVGLYYVINFTYTEYERYWWGTMVTGTPDKKLSAVGVNESSLIMSFIYIQIGDNSGQTYYSSY